MRKLSRAFPIVLAVAVVSAIVWWMLRPAAQPSATPTPSASALSGCQPVEATAGAAPATLTTADWEVSVKEVRSAAELPREGGGEMHAEPGKVFVVGTLTFHRLGSPDTPINSEDVSIVCAGGGGMTPGYWSTDGKRFCFPCSFDVATEARSTDVSFAFKTERARAASSFALDYRGSGPIPLGPPTTGP
jgi:hypothetical protein